MYDGKRRRTCIAASVELHANGTRLDQVCRRVFELVRGKSNLSPGQQYEEHLRDRDASLGQAATETHTLSIRFDPGDVLHNSMRVRCRAMLRASAL